MRAKARSGQGRSRSATQALQDSGGQAKRYVSIDVDRVVVERLKIAAAKRGWMRYSIVAETLLAQAYKDLDKFDQYSEITKKYRDELTGFQPLKRGKPRKGTTVHKQKLTLYLSPATIKNHYRLNHRFGLSLSGACELLLRIGLGT